MPPPAAAEIMTLTCHENQRRQISTNSAQHQKPDKTQSVLTKIHRWNVSPVFVLPSAPSWGKRQERKANKQNAAVVKVSGQL